MKFLLLLLFAGVSLLNCTAEASSLVGQRDINRWGMGCNDVNYDYKSTPETLTVPIGINGNGNKFIMISDVAKVICWDKYISDHFNVELPLGESRTYGGAGTAYPGYYYYASFLQEGNVFKISISCSVSNYCGDLRPRGWSTSVRFSGLAQ